MDRHAYTDAELDRAVAALTPERLGDAQDLVARRAPQLQRVLDAALAHGGWFGGAHEAELLKAAGVADVDERLRSVRTLVADETRLAMLVGVAIGFGLSRELDHPTTDDETED